MAASWRSAGSDNTQGCGGDNLLLSTTVERCWREYDIYEGPAMNANNNDLSEEEAGFGLDLFCKDPHKGGEDDEILEYPIRNYGSNEQDGCPSTTLSSSSPTTLLELRGQSDYSNSTGVTVWLGSEIMSEYLQSYPTLVRQKHVLELGAGLGLCGLIAHHLGARRVTLTDGDSEVLKRLRSNIQSNARKNTCHIIDCQQLIWGQQQTAFAKTNGKYSVILASDCIYMTTSLNPFWQTVRSLLQDNGSLIYINLCASQAPTEQVLDVARKDGFVWSTFNYKSKPVYTFRLKPQTTQRRFDNNDDE